ncbi:MAG: hypothetical protein K2X81_09830, partial [Candidatus Obscuribacterales bacterium]|nr:hypothetical protein [Candidatus Obscuribacterales bacterium]
GNLLSAVADKLWKGKIVDRAHGCLVNKLLGLHIIKAEIFKGPSWSDAGEAVIVDYRHSSYLAFFIRDEIREVQAGLFLGKCYIRLPMGLRTNLLYFTLDFRN